MMDEQIDELVMELKWINYAQLNRRYRGQFNLKETSYGKSSLDDRAQTA